MVDSWQGQEKRDLSRLKAKGISILFFKKDDCWYTTVDIQHNFTITTYRYLRYTTVDIWHNFTITTYKLNIYKLSLEEFLHFSVCNEPLPETTSFPHLVLPTSSLETFGSPRCSPILVQMIQIQSPAIITIIQVLFSCLCSKVTVYRWTCQCLFCYINVIYLGSAALFLKHDICTGDIVSTGWKERFEVLSWPAEWEPYCRFAWESRWT